MREALSPGVGVLVDSYENFEQVTQVEIFETTSTVLRAGDGLG